jgi:hypothetical protein
MEHASTWKLFDMMEAPFAPQNEILFSVVKVNPFSFPKILHKMKVVVQLNYLQILQTVVAAYSMLIMLLNFIFSFGIIEHHIEYIHI